MSSWTVSKSSSNKESDSEKSRKKLEKSLWLVLNDFYPKSSILQTHNATKGIIKSVERYCRYRHTTSKSSHATKPKPSTPKDQLVGFSKPVKSSNGAKSSSANKSSCTSKSYNVVQTSTVEKSFSTTVTTSAAKSTSAKTSFTAQKSSTTSKSHTSVKSSSAVNAKPNSSSTQRNAIKHQETELEKELKRLADSDGFVTSYPLRYKRVPKPVERFSLTQNEKKRTRQAVARRQDKKIDEVDKPTNKKCKITEDKAVYKVQQHQTFSKTTSTIGWYHLNKKKY